MFEEYRKNVELYLERESKMRTSLGLSAVLNEQSKYMYNKSWERTLRIGQLLEVPIDVNWRDLNTELLLYRAITIAEFIGRYRDDETDAVLEYVDCMRDALKAAHAELKSRIRVTLLPASPLPSER